MPFVNMHAITREHTPPEVPHHLQPHLAGRGFVATELVLLTGAVFGALVGYWFTFAVAPRRHSWPRAARLSFAAVLAVVSMALGYFDNVSILASSCLGYVIGLAIGSGAVLLTDDFEEVGERELPLRLFAVLWSPALVGGFVGGLYNEILYHAGLGIALLKISLALAGCSVAMFVLLFVTQLVDHRVARRVLD